VPINPSLFLSAIIGETLPIKLALPMKRYSTDRQFHLAIESIYSRRICKSKRTK
jgi:hypothetical protein